MPKKVTFQFPDDAWDGIQMSLTEYSYQAFVPNPAYAANPATEPQQIPNPVTREEAATQVIVDFVEQRYKEWARRAAMAPVEQQVQAQVETRAAEVRTATSITVEAIE
jgi:hypothetical protein